ncbi:MAG: 4Fe-4S binding protein [Coriobacteriales bacterium]|nr:4Fe-4S binding protein [Coriobacteriales bacterium]
MSSKKKIGTIGIARRCVQLLMLVLYALPLIVAGWGLLGGFVGGEEAATTPSDLPVWGSLSASSIFGISLVDPFATLQTIVASKQFAAAMVGALPILIVYTLIRGRAFCGWICPVNLVLEFVDWLRAKLGLKVAENPIPRKTKIFVAAGILVLSAITCVPLFEAVNPIGALSKALLFGSVLGVWTLLAIIVAELFWGRRVWCRSLCPLGGFYQVLGAVGFVSVKIDSNACVRCGTCKKHCLCNSEILDKCIEGQSARVAAGDCMLCGKCVDSCPTKALSIGFAIPKNPEL